MEGVDFLGAKEKNQKLSVAGSESGLRERYAQFNRILEDAEAGSDDDEVVDDMAIFLNEPCQSDADCGKSRFLHCKTSKVHDEDEPDIDKLCVHKTIFPM